MKSQVQCCIDADLIQEAQGVVDRLKNAGLTVVTAESCTGGLVASCLTYGKEASACFHGAFVVYTKTQKAEALGVDTRVLREHGAVNPEVARQMAEGALQRSAASVAIAITGVLGPDPDEDGNPPGLVYFGLARQGKPTELVRCEFSSSHPDSIREQSVWKAFLLLREAATQT